MANLTRMRNTRCGASCSTCATRDADGEEGLRRVRRRSARSIRSSRSTRSSSPSRRAAASRRSSPPSCAAPFNETKLVACAKEQAKKDGRDVTVSDYNGKKLYTDSQKAEAWATFLDGKTVVVGGKEWVKKVVDLAAGKGESAKANAELAALVKRAKTSDALWGAGHRAAVDARLVQERSAPVVGGVDEGHLRLGRLRRRASPSELNVDTGTRGGRQGAVGQGDGAARRRARRARSS